MKRKVLYGIIGGIVFLILGLVMGLTTGMNIGGNYYPNFQWRDSRGYMATGNIGALIGGGGGLVFGVLIGLYLAKQREKNDGYGSLESQFLKKRRGTIMDLLERYIEAGLKHIPKMQQAEVERAMRRILAERLKGSDPTSEEAIRQELQQLGNPRLFAEKQLQEGRHLIGPELYGTYVVVVKIVMIVAVLGTLVGNTIDFIVNDTDLWQFFIQTLGTAIRAAIGAFGWVTLVFAFMERTAKQKVLTEIQEDWDWKDLPEKEAAQKPFSRIGVTIGMVFTVLVIILVNRYLHLVGYYYWMDGTLLEMLPLFNQTVFANYLPYVNVLLVLQLIFSASKLVFRKWTYPIATANLVLNLLTFLLFLLILQDTAVWNPDIINPITEMTANPRTVTLAIRGTLIVTLFILLFDSFEGFRDAYQNKKYTRPND